MPEPPPELLLPLALLLLPVPVVVVLFPETINYVYLCFRVLYRCELKEMTN